MKIKHIILTFEIPEIGDRITKKVAFADFTYKTSPLKVLQRINKEFAELLEISLDRLEKYVEDARIE